MAVRIALGGDTMLGRGVGEVITERPDGLFADEVAETFRRADLSLLNLECCVSDRGAKWPAPGKPFHFRAPPEAVRTLTELGVDCVTLANNHSLDYGPEALEDTLDRLRQAGIKAVGAGRNRDEARRPAILGAQDMTIAVLGVTDHPEDYAATETTPGVAYAALAGGVPGWLTDHIARLSAVYDAVVITPHWGPNMTTTPLPYIREAAESFVEAGATLVAGHSAHVFHAAKPGVIYDLGDLMDDYVRDEDLRNDLGLLWTATIHRNRTVDLEAQPLRLAYAHTRVANEEERIWIRTRLTGACREFSTEVTERNGRLAVKPTAHGRASEPSERET
jgi:poly-gamma-glutamate capsule biosynthesis protein CapA/YwtB (metallophosphatase superfamily)